MGEGEEGRERINKRESEWAREGKRGYRGRMGGIKENTEREIKFSFSACMQAMHSNICKSVH